QHQVFITRCHPRNLEPLSDDEDDTGAATPSPIVNTTRRLLGPDIFNVHQTRLHVGSSVESGFEPGSHWSRGRDLTTRPPRPY
ncbi:hypothetical protein AVEN_89906-1, partial [Araneus ventricosus]